LVWEKTLKTACLLNAKIQLYTEFLVCIAAIMGRGKLEPHFAYFGLTEVLASQEPLAWEKNFIKQHI